MGGIKSKLQVKDFNEKDLQMVNVKTPMNPEDVEKSLLYLEQMQNVGKEQEQQKSLEKQEGPLKITFFGDDDVEEMLDLTTLYKYINSNIQSASPATPLNKNQLKISSDKEKPKPKDSKKDSNVAKTENNSKVVSPPKLNLQPAMTPFKSTIMEVSCNGLKGLLHTDRFISGGIGECIQEWIGQEWMTPNKFELQAGSKQKKYKASIRSKQGITLQEYIEKGYLIEQRIPAIARRSERHSTQKLEK